ncbi:hypothetical protein [Tropicimonas sp. IMCC6043]|uniref:hypothetical protein n=1 Tax=Tropicimonas sp. IMCC6043 TaxID=2510645 RepID=UPI0013EAD491|nr:hypothetical protein [Tropicimonas sp. IMCC6043]
MAVAKSRDGFGVRRLMRAGGRYLHRILLGRRFVHSLERNREAADRLDSAIKEMLGR